MEMSAPEVWALSLDCTPGRSRGEGLISWNEVARTTESFVSAINVQTWQRGSLHRAALRLEKSEGTFDEPARWWTFTAYRLTIDRKAVSRGEGGNSPRHSFLTA